MIKKIRDMEPLTIFKEAYRNRISIFLGVFCGDVKIYEMKDPKKENSQPWIVGYGSSIEMDIEKIIGRIGPDGKIAEIK